MHCVVIECHPPKILYDEKINSENKVSTEINQKNILTYLKNKRQNRPRTNLHVPPIEVTSQIPMKQQNISLNSWKVSNETLSHT